MAQRTKFRLQKSLFAAASVLALSATTNLAQAQATETTRFDIPEQNLSAALIEFSRQSDVTVIAPTSMTEGLKSAPVNGQHTPEDAIQILLSNASLDMRTRNDGVIILSQADASTSLGEETPSAPFRVAQVDQEDDVRRIDRRDDEQDSLDVIVVTGTNIRGIAPESSPIRTFDREDIQISGAATAQDFIQTLPQNFSGGASEFGSSPGNQQAGSNIANGSSVNLRGLGSGSTLVLLNGRRVAPSSDIGGFVDISMIPASAIERVEVLTDGASSIYGADAVAGVTNFVLRDDFDGIEASFKYGTATEGGINDYRGSVTGGKNWSTGNGLLVYEYYKRDNLDNSDRSFSDNFLSPNDLLPRQERHSVIGTITQQLAPNLTLGGDVLYSNRDSLELGTALTGSATGRLSEFSIDSENLNLGASLNWNIAGDFYVDIAGTYSEVTTDVERSRGGVLDLTSNTNSDLLSIESIVSGTILELPAGPAKLALGGHFRHETFLNSSDTRGVTRDGTRDVYAVFGEAFIPVFGPGNAIPGIRAF